MFNIIHPPFMVLRCNITFLTGVISFVVSQFVLSFMSLIWILVHLFLVFHFTIFSELKLSLWFISKIRSVNTIFWCSMFVILHHYFTLLHYSPIKYIFVNIAFPVSFPNFCNLS